MSILKLIMCVYVVNTIPSTSTSLHTSCELLFIMIAKTILIKLAHWLMTIHTPCQLNFCRVAILTLVEVMELRLLLPGLRFLHFALNSAHCVPGVIKCRIVRHCKQSPHTQISVCAELFKQKIQGPGIQ